MPRCGGGKGGRWHGRAMAWRSRWRRTSTEQPSRVEVEGGCGEPGSEDGQGGEDEVLVFVEGLLQLKDGRRCFELIPVRSRLAELNRHQRLALSKCLNR